MLVAPFWIFVLSLVFPAIIPCCYPKFAKGFVAHLTRNPAYSGLAFVCMILWFIAMGIG